MAIQFPKKADSGVLPAFSNYQKFVVSILAFLQFTIVLDFMILSPLGATLIADLNITPSQFGLVVSAYAFCAGLSGFLTAGFADRFDRKKLLLFFYAGFIGGTLLCGLATNYQFLLMARMITGIFSGVIGSIVFAITTDLFALEMRGRVMGIVQTSFAVSQVLGIPMGLYISNYWGWNSTFLMIVVFSAIVGGIIIFYLRPIDAHLKLQSTHNPVQHLIRTISSPRYLQGFAATALLSVGGFMILPFMSAYSVHNLGIDLKDLPMVYMVTGGCSILAGPYIGRLSDRFGKFKTFLFGVVLTIVMVLIYTNLGVTPLHWVILINVFLYIGVSSRIISAGAMMSALPRAADRGAFMSISSSIQQISGGIASVVAGSLVVQGVGGHLEHFNRVGYCVTATTLITLLMMYFIDQKIKAGNE